METPDEHNSFFTDESSGVCYACHYVLPRLVHCAPGYFAQGYVVCEDCGEKVDLWKALSLGAELFKMAPAFSLTNLGAAKTRFVRPLESGRFYEFDLEEYGVPSGAKILSTSIHGCGGDDGTVSALLWHSTPVSRRVHGTKFSVIAVPLGEGKLPRVGLVSIFVIWIRQEESDGWVYLLNAFEAAGDGEHAASLVFAQSAIEITLMPLLSKRLREFASGDNVKSFMSDSLKFSHALNVLLPTLCGLLDIPQMPDSIRGALNRLRKKRNLIIHEGVTKANVTPDETAEGLCAAALGFEYVRYIAPKLSSDATDG
jgi:hypothetical protein